MNFAVRLNWPDGTASQSMSKSQNGLPRWPLDRLVSKILENRAKRQIGPDRTRDYRAAHSGQHSALPTYSHPTGHVQVSPHPTSTAKSAKAMPNNAPFVAKIFIGFSFFAPEFTHFRFGDPNPPVAFAQPRKQTGQFRQSWPRPIPKLNAIRFLGHFGPRFFVRIAL